MARERTPEGKRIVIPVRVSEPKAEAIDAARGDTPRSVWVETAIDAFLASGRGPQRKPVQSRNMAVPPRAPVPPKSTALPKAPPAPVRFREPEACPHRLPVGAYCKTCGRTKT